MQCLCMQRRIAFFSSVFGIVHKKVMVRTVCGEVCLAVPSSCFSSS